MDVSRYVKINKEVKLKCTCTCTHVFSVTLERRKHLRKIVNLKGNAIFEKKKYPINVIDISRLGLKIRTKEVLNFKPEDTVMIDFILDDATASSVSKEVVIRTINETDIGVEFLSLDHYDKLGTYLLFHFN